MKTIVGVLLFAAVQLVFIKHVNAYIDPGTGSMVVQAVIAVVATVSVSIGIFWRRIKLFLTRFLNRKKGE